MLLCTAVQSEEKSYHCHDIYLVSEKGNFYVGTMHFDINTVPVPTLYP